MEIARRLNARDQWKTQNENTNERCERSGLRTRGHKAGDRSRSAFVYVRRPDVKWYSRYFKSKADHHHRAADEKQSREVGVSETFCDLGHVRGAGRTVNERHTVEQERRCERAKYEILHRRFVRLQISAPQAA